MRQRPPLPYAGGGGRSLSDGESPSPQPSPAARERGSLAAATLLALLASGCGTADTPDARATDAASDTPPAVATVAADAGTTPSSATHPLDPSEALCRPADHGSLRARLQGAIDAEIDWSAPAQPQCIGGARPGGDGLRLVYKGNAGNAPLLIIVGIAIAPEALRERHLPASITIVREGSGEFFATQGDDKCALDEVAQEPIDASTGRSRLSGRGYCTQPARALGTAEGSVLVSRFDVEAIVEHPRER
jgi:hypothetical protein